MQHNPAFEKLCETARQNVKEIDVNSVKKQMETGNLPLLLDVREESEWGSQHLPDAQHLGRGILERDIETRVPNKETPLILYCGGGYRSVLAAESLQKMGYTAVLSMAGGYKAWVMAGYSVTDR